MYRSENLKINRPSLILHDSFYLEKWQIDKLKSIFDIRRVADILGDVKYASPILLSRNKSSRRARVTLTPHYEARIGSGAEPDITSYYFERETRAYKIERSKKNRRYVVWTENEPLPVCATIVDRSRVENLNAALDRAYDWGRVNVSQYALLRPRSVIVFDLDETLIDGRDNVARGAAEILKKARSIFDLVILWSHGSPLHVDASVLKLKKEIKEKSELFDRVLCNDQYWVSPKNLLHLYNAFPDCYFVRAVLVDDSVYNWTPEYDEFYVPTSNDLESLSDYL